MDRYRRIIKCLIVGITKYKTYIVNAFPVHVVDCIAAATTYTDHFDDAIFLFRFTEIKDMWFAILHNLYIL